MKKLLIGIIIVTITQSLYAETDNTVELFFMKTSAGEVKQVEYKNIDSGNFVSPKVDDNNPDEISTESTKKKFGEEGERPGLAITFRISRDGVSGDEGDYMIAAFLSRTKGIYVNAPNPISFSNVNFIFSGKLSINGSPVKGEVHFMQIEMSDKNSWLLGFNDGILSNTGEIKVCTQNGGQYRVQNSANDAVNQFIIYPDTDDTLCNIPT